jgi:hypothetical protein
MDTPNLQNVYETFIKIPSKKREDTVETIKRKLLPVISEIQSHVNWYCFLIHLRDEGVPTRKDDEYSYVHLRFSPYQSAPPKLPKYCIMTRKCEESSLREIFHYERDESFIPDKGKVESLNPELLEDCKVETYWKIIGEISELVIDIIRLHKDTISVSNEGILTHYFFNMMGLESIEQEIIRARRLQIEKSAFTKASH